MPVPFLHLFCSDAISRAKNRKTKQTSSDERKLAAIRQKIERGTENLVLADRENFEAISNLLSRWRDEEAALIDRVQRRTTELEPLPEAIDVIERLGELFSKLKKADRLKLADAVRRTGVNFNRHANGEDRRDWASLAIR